MRVICSLQSAVMSTASEHNMHDTSCNLQGLAAWVGLKSRRGEPVGAVQLKVSLTQLNGRLMADPRLDSAAAVDPCTVLSTEPH